MDSVIVTGVDKLVQLIEKDKRISVKDAAVQLGVPPAVIEEWADFLEEEGIISIEYKLTNTFLVERKLSEKDVMHKAKEFKGKKEGFVRKVEGALMDLERESKGLDIIKKEFDELQDKIGSEINVIKGKLSELERYERMKKEIDNEMFEQRKQFNEKITEVEKNLLNEQKRYQQIMDDLNIEKVHIEKERERVHTMEEKETQIIGKIEDLQKSLHDMRKEISDDDHVMKDSEHKINKLAEYAEDVKKDIEKKRETINQLIKDSKDKEEKIMQMENDLIDEVRKKKGELDQDLGETTELTKKVEAFFKRKKEISVMLDKVMIDRDILGRELHEVMKKAIAFDIASKTGLSKKEMEDLRKKFTELEEKKGFFQKELEKLQKFISGKSE